MADEPHITPPSVVAVPLGLPFAHGAFADIYRGELQCSQADTATESHGRMTVAVKVLRTSRSNTRDHQRIGSRLCRETAVWASLRHSNLMSAIKFCSVSEDHLPAIVQPYFKNGNVMFYLRAHPTIDRLPLLRQTAEALNFLHTMPQTPIVHGDIKGENVLISDSGTAQLADFGLSSVIQDTGMYEPEVSAEAGCMRFMAPELLNPSSPAQTSTKTDIYAFGMLIYQIYTGKVPFYQIRSGAQLFASICRGDTPHCPTELSGPEVESVWRIAQSCWTTTDTRPTAGHIAMALAE